MTLVGGTEEIVDCPRHAESRLKPSLRTASPDVSGLVAVDKDF